MRVGEGAREERRNILVGICFSLEEKCFSKHLESSTLKYLILLSIWYLEKGCTSLTVLHV